MNAELRNEIVRRRQGGASMRRIARDLNLARQTVHNVIHCWEAERAGEETSGDQQAAKRRPSRLDAYDDAIGRLLDR